jgi:hypothetical protein
MVSSTFASSMTPPTGRPSVCSPAGTLTSASRPSQAMTCAVCTSSQSWSSVAIQKTGTAGVPRAVRQAASFTAESAL